MTTKEEQIMVFHAMTILIEEKGARNKMTSIYNITKMIRDEGIETSKLLVEACLDILIQKKYVRYYVNEKRYIYYGITELGWTRWDAKIAKESNASEEQPTQEEGVTA